MSLCRRKYSRIVYGFCRYRWNMCTEGKIFGKNPVFPDNSHTHPSLAGIAGNAGINGMGIVDTCSSSGRRTLLAEISNNGGIGTYERKTIVMRQAELNKKLFEAAESGDIAGVKAAMSLGADINSTDDNGETALMKACWRGYIETVRLLIEHGADVSIKDDNGKTALDLAYRNGYANIVSLLLKKEIVQPLKEQQGHSDKTVLQKKLNKKLLNAVYTDNMGGVEEALSLGADVNAADDDGWTPLIYAAYRGNTDITILLLKYRTNINAVDKYGNTALMTVCWRGNTDMVKLLLRYGADINIVSNDGNTALINACRKGYTDIARLLIEHGADINIINSTGLTALDILKGYHPKKYKK